MGNGMVLMFNDDKINFNNPICTQFLVLIRVLELISFPKHSRETFICLKLNTLSSWKILVRLDGF